MAVRDAKVLVFSVPVLAFAIILVYIVLWNVYLSFMNWSALTPQAKFVGFSTYAAVFSDALFISSLVRSLLWAGGLVLIGNALGIFLAALIYFVRSSRLRSVYLSLFVYPLAIPMAATALIWTWLFNVQDGINVLLRAVGIPGLPWLSEPSTAFPSLLLVTVWVFSGLAALFYLASFYNVEQSVIESARIDGAGSGTIFHKILLPASKNAFIVSTALLLLFALRIFSLPYVSTGLNPYTETATLNLYYFFITEYFSRSAGVSVIIVVIATIIVIPYALYGIKRWISS
ncbi:MAG: glucose ABC transporter permease GlcT [Thermoprotei archaeon]